MWPALAVALAAAVLLLAVAMLRSRKPEPPLDPEAAMRAAVELHRIGRQLDVDWTKAELRRDADRLEHRIVEIIDGDDEP
jgi:hypothetical protein